MRTPRTRRNQPQPSIAEGAESRSSPPSSLSPPPQPPPPSCTPRWSHSHPSFPSSNKDLALPAGVLGSVQPRVRRSLRLSATSQATDGDSTQAAKCVPTERSSSRRPRRSGDVAPGKLVGDGAAGVGEAAGEVEANEFRVSGSSETGCYMNLRSGVKIVRRERVEDSAERRMAARGGDPSRAEAPVDRCVEDAAVNLTVATVDEPEEDAMKGRKRARLNGRKASEMGVRLSEDVFPSFIISEGHDDRAGTVESFLRDDFVSGKAQIAVFSSNTKQEDKSDCEYLSLRSGSRLRRKTIGGDFNQVEIAETGTKFNAPETDRDSLIIGRTQGMMKDDNNVGETSAAKSKGKSILVVEENDNEIDRNMDVGISARNDVGKHLVNTDVSEGNSSGMNFVSRREADRARARALASKFAFFKEDVIGEGDEDTLEEGEEPNDLVLDSGEEDWPGPFSTAMKIIRERDEKLKARKLSSSSKKDECTKVRIPWKPSMRNGRKPFVRSCPTLKHMCMKVLVDHAEEIESLEGIPDVLRNRLILMLCHARKMSYQILDLLVSSSCAEIHLSDCSWATEVQFEKIFTKCNTNILKVVQLDLSGRCMPDYVLRTTLARSPNSLPMLTSLSLKGAYRLSDNGLNAIVSSAPSLRSLNLSQCSLVTSSGIINLVEKLDGVLRELYIDDCYNVDVMIILPALKKLKHLEVLSLAGVRSVSHKFVRGLIPACGSNLREFCLAGCWKVTDSSIKTISEHCPSLCVIDLRNLSKLTDCSLKHLANGCQSLQKLKLRQTAFSDDAVAAFLEASGRCLIELMLNNVKQVAEHTALAISRQCSSLQNLDLSFCREMTDEALGIIVDSCLRLRFLKLFGCTQVTDVFLNGHSNCEVKVIGLKGQILDEIEIPDFL